jgi:hypothetical protein
MDLDVLTLEEFPYPFDPVTHHGTTDVVGVIVRGQRTDHRHAVRAHQLEKFADVVRGIDQHTLTRGPIADRIHEVHHLNGYLIAAGKVATRQQLAEVEPVVHDAQLTSQRGPIGTGPAVIA